MTAHWMHRTLSTLYSLGQPHAEANGVASFLRNSKNQILHLFESYQVHIWDAVRPENRKVCLYQKPIIFTYTIYIYVYILCIYIVYIYMYI